MDLLNPHEVREALVGNETLANLSAVAPTLPEADKLANIDVTRAVAPVEAFLSASNPDGEISIKTPDSRMGPL